MKRDFENLGDYDGRDISYNSHRRMPYPGEPWAMARGWDIRPRRIPKPKNSEAQREENLSKEDKED